MNTNPRGDIQTIMRVITLILSLFIGMDHTVRLQASPDADQAYQAALKSFQDKWFDRAEEELGQFIRKYPQSPRIPEALLLQARSRFELKQFRGAIELLTANQARAGAFSDQYRFLIAEAQLQESNLTTAAEGYASVIRDFPQSSLRLDASYGQAFCHYKLGDLPRVIELLGNPTNTFAQVSMESTNDALVLRGHLLLAEAYSTRKEYAAAAAALSKLEARKLQPELDWQRQFFLATTAVADNRSQEALERVTNLVALAISAGKPVLHANSLTLRAEVLRPTQPDAAIQAFEEVVQLKGISVSQTRQALLKIVDLMLAQNRSTNAIDRLELFLRQNPTEPSFDLVRLTLGELYLKQFYGATSLHASARTPDQTHFLTNSLHEARLQFSEIIQMTNTSHLGKAHLNRGWSFWEEGTLQRNPLPIGRGLTDFRKASELLVAPEEKALARLKWADCHFQLRDYTNAFNTYRLLVEEFAEAPAIRAKLLDQAIEKMIRIRLEAKDFAGARAELSRMFDWFPQSPWTEQALLVLGQALLNDGQPKEARDALAELETRFPNSPWVPDARQAIAKSFAQQKDWAAAIPQYDRWMEAHTNHPARAQVEFDRAWAHYQAGNETNAFALYTNFVARFPGSPLAPLAQFWVADYFYRQGEYLTAEMHYQHKLLLQAPSDAADLRYQARLMAGKAALRREKPAEAWDHVNRLINDPDCPQSLIPEAWFVLGDIFLEQKGGTNSLERFANAINAYKNVLLFTNAHRLEPLALGKIANCHLVLAVNDRKRYESATNEFFKVLVSPHADITARSQAQVGIGIVLQKQAEEINSGPEQTRLLEAALGHFLDVVFGRHQRPGERPDPFWVKEAGQAAGSLAERLRKTPQAIQLYERLLAEVPAGRSAWEKRLKLLRQQEPID